MLDYRADRATLGKNIGDDLAEGKPTLPLIHAMRLGNSGQSALLRNAIEKGGLDQISAVVAAIESTGSIAYTAHQAEAEAGLAKEALAVLPETPFKQALLDLAHFSVHRNH
ncbi:MAG: hypothetical protein A2V58_04595 [Candidatus Muproteobacteria bacterium RBG_19FT_COMBO_61_10]|uniref:Octaprenyl diphosphate synthase n=1 Tax=Candidatus Muproteobacteria bacterium RBG_19FT_COMBO_61_10 TaxID=1817761 RepID=A0A1F6UME4_9PROT|nr:MAG: hypothetical protein A2V58_04595 [Candidatus Muproteobacteria bacterium RBG_19FT_COMBO_61_10]